MSILNELVHFFIPSSVCDSLIYPAIFPLFICLITYPLTYLYNCANKYNLDVITIQYVVCSLLMTVNSVNFILKDVDILRYMKDMNSNIPIQGWYIDYFYLKVLCFILYLRFSYLKDKNKISYQNFFDITNFYIDIFYEMFMSYFLPGSFILSVMYSFNKINRQQFVYTTKIQKYISLTLYSIILFYESYNWINFVVKWDNCFLNEFYDMSTPSAIYITTLMIIVYLFQIILLIEIDNYNLDNLYFTVILVYVSFCNGTISMCLYMMYFEIYKTKIFRK